MRSVFCGLPLRVSLTIPTKFCCIVQNHNKIYDVASVHSRHNTNTLEFPQDTSHLKNPLYPYDLHQSTILTRKLKACQKSFDFDLSLFISRCKSLSLSVLNNLPIFLNFCPGFRILTRMSKSLTSFLNWFLNADVKDCQLISSAYVHSLGSKCLFYK